MCNPDTGLIAPRSWNPGKPLGKCVPKQRSTITHVIPGGSVVTGAQILQNAAEDKKGYGLGKFEKVLKRRNRKGCTTDTDGGRAALKGHLQCLKMEYDECTKWFPGMCLIIDVTEIRLILS